MVPPFMPMYSVLVWAAAGAAGDAGGRNGHGQRGSAQGRKAEGGFHWDS